MGLSKSSKCVTQWMAEKYLVPFLAQFGSQSCGSQYNTMGRRGSDKDLLATTRVSVRLYLTSSADWTSFPQMSLVWNIWNSSGLLLFQSDNDDDGLIFVTWCCKQFVRSVSAASMRPSSRLTAPPPAFLPFVNTASLPIIKDECMLMHIFRASGKCAKMFLEFKNAKFKV